VVEDQRVRERELWKSRIEKREKVVEVAKGEVNPDHWIWKGYVVDICTLQRFGPLENLQTENWPKSN
jgi:hypothetical protein